MLLRLREQTPPLRKKKGEEALEKIAGWPAFQRAGWLFSYVSMGYELDTTALIDRALGAGKRVAAPVIFDEGKKSGSFLISEIRDRLKELEIGPFGISQPKPRFLRPVDPKVLEMAVIPGVAFGKDGHRLGHGKGYFDRFLRQLSPNCLKVGIAFDFQLLPELPHEPHDVSLDVIVTNREILQKTSPPLTGGD